jgi:DNA polymerase III alpha subunit/DNA polymerase III epsilon subunit-like protein
MPNEIKQSMDELNRVHDIVVKIKANLKPNQKVVIVMDSETTGLAYDNYELQNQQKRNQFNPQLHLDKMIELGGIYAIEETDDEGKKTTIEIADQSGDGSLGFRYFFNPWLDDVTDFPDEMPEGSYAVHRVSRGFLNGTEAIAEFNEILSAPAPSAHDEVDGISYIEKIMLMFNEASVMVAHNINFDINVVNATIRDQNKKLRQENAQDLNARLKPLKAELEEVENEIAEFKSATMTDEILEEVESKEEVVSEIKKKILSEETPKKIPYYSGELLDTLAKFREFIPNQVQVAMQGSDTSSPTNHKLDTGMLLAAKANGELDAKREIHGAYEDSRLLLGFYKYLQTEHENRAMEVAKAEDIINYSSNFTLEGAEGYPDSTTKQEGELIKSSFNVDQKTKRASSSVIDIDSLIQHLTEQLRPYDAMVAGKKAKKDNINSTRIKSASPNYAKEENINASIEFLENFIFKTMDKVSSLDELGEKIAKVKIPAKNKDAKLSLVKAAFAYTNLKLSNQLKDNFIKQAGEVMARSEGMKEVIEVSKDQTNNYFHGHRSVPTSKKAEQVSVIGSVDNVKTLLEECRDGGIAEITFTDFNNVTSWYNDQKYIDAYKEENPESPIQVNYGITTLLEVDGVYSQVNLVAKTQEGLHSIMNVLTRASDNSISDPHLRLDDLTEDIIGDLMVNHGGKKGLVETAIRRDSGESAMEGLIERAEKILAKTGELNIEFSKADVMINQYSQEFVNRLRQRNPDAKITKVFSNEVLHLNDDAEMHSFRERSMKKDSSIEEASGLIPTITLTDKENLEYLSASEKNIDEYALPNNPPALPDFLGDMEFIKKHSPEVYEKLGKSGFYKEDFLSKYLPTTSKHLSENEYYQAAKADNDQLPGSAYDLENTNKNYLKSVQIDYFIREAMSGMKMRAEMLELTPEQKVTYYERLDYELSVMISMDFPGYHLLVKDFLDTLTDKIGGNKGPGRGSAAGSLVAYSLGITNADPLNHKLLFERYLNPERVSFPDIDMDMHGNVSVEKLLNKDKLTEEFRQMVRDEYGPELEKYPDLTAPAKTLLELHEKSKYGEKSVLNLITIGTFKPKSSIDLVCKDLGNEAAKASGLPLKSGGTPYIEMASLIKGEYFDHPGTTFSDVMSGEDASEEFKDLYNSNATVKYIVDLALKLENTASHFGTHAAGVVIVKPTEGLLGKAVMGIGGKSVTAIDGKNVEDQLGIKFDFLGLEALSIIDDTLSILGATISDEKEKEIRDLMMNEKSLYADPKIYQEMSKGNSYEIFQFASDLMKDLTKKILPQDIAGKSPEEVGQLFYDLVAITALGRPGADSELYIENLNNPEGIEYSFPELEGVLSETYGVPVYQEQIMEMVQLVGGFSLGEADSMRRAMGKKLASEMVAMEGKFVQGAVDKHPDEDEATVLNKAKQLWKFILPFAEYGFNKSHAVAYTQVSMQQAYLKFNYPEQYFTSLLRNKSGDIDKLTDIIVDAKENGIELEPCDINKSMKNFEYRDDSIRYGLDVIKGTSESDVDLIMTDRQANGEYKTIGDFINRTMKAKNNINVRTIKGLVWSGAMDVLSISDLGDHIASEDHLKDFYKEIESDITDEMISPQRKRAILMKALMSLNNQSPTKKQTQDLEDDYNELNSVLGASMIELDKTGSYASIGSPLQNPEVIDGIMTEGIDVQPLDMTKTPFDTDQKLSSLAVVSKVSGGQDGEGKEYASIEIMDVNGKPKKVHLLESQANSFNKKEVVEAGDVIEIDLDISVNSNGYAKVTPGNVFTYKENDNWGIKRAIEKDRFSIDDIETNLKVYEAEDVKRIWKDMESTPNGGKFTLIQKGYQQRETKAGKEMYIFELTDGKSGRVVEFMHFNPLNTAAVEANNGFPIEIEPGKYNPNFGMSSGYGKSPKFLGANALNATSKDRESEFLNKKAPSSNAGKDEVKQKHRGPEVIDGVKYPMSFNIKANGGVMKKFKRSNNRSKHNLDSGKQAALYSSEDGESRIWITVESGDTGLVHFKQAVSKSDKTYGEAKDPKGSDVIILRGFDEADKDSLIEKNESIKTIYGNKIFINSKNKVSIIESLDELGFVDATGQDYSKIQIDPPYEAELVAPFEYPPKKVVNAGKGKGMDNEVDGSPKK